MTRAVACLIVFLLFNYSGSSFALDKKNRVEDLMIWKISDELKLNSKEEEIFASVFKKLNQRKNELNRSMQETIAKSGPESEKETVLRLQVYLKQIQDYNKLSEEEFDELKKIFSPSRMIQYFKIKQDLSTRLKLILSQGEGEKKSNRKLPPPQIIEEK